MNPEGSVGYMHKNVVQGDCTDGDNGCPGWAPQYCANGYFDSGPLKGNKIKNLCRKSCGMCVDANLGI